ncbi:MAG: hypothetical protein NC098_04475 [Lachnoclostridium sp.]|nr:hypothetical protein [Lachnoclostridium sp.]
MKLNKLVIIVVAALTSLGASAIVNEKILTSAEVAGNNLLAYPVSGFPELTPAPEVYTPVHIEHYGRHGSRWLIAETDYTAPVVFLESVDNAGALTDTGKELLAKVKSIAADAAGNSGRLTSTGARQHQGIARRMYHNFPEIFADSAVIDAKSTVVVRCLLSMVNELTQFAALAPEATIYAESGWPLQPTLNPCDFATDAQAKRNAADPAIQAFRRKVVHPQRFIASIMDTTKVAVNQDQQLQLFHEIFEIAFNEQSHGRPILASYFTPEEIDSQWQVNNARWYVHSGYSPLSDGEMPEVTRPLLEAIIVSADSALMTGGPEATLRFGHESVLLPLVCAMQINGKDVVVDSLEDVASVWKAYEVFPMGGNLQLIYYTADAREPLVKILLNEKEAKLPIDQFSPGFYRWKDVKNLWSSPAHAK